MRFMATMTRKATTTPEAVQALVPAETAHIGELTKAGVIEATYVSQQGAWVVIHADSAEKANEIVKTFPLYPLLDGVITPIFG